MAFYETTGALSEYLLLHYGEPDLVLPYSFGPKDALNFPVRTVSENFFSDEHGGERVLDLGCAVGRSSFELSRLFEKVVGVDYSESFIEAAKHLQQRGSLEYNIRIEGPRTQKVEAIVPKDTHPERVSFLCCDAANLPENIGTFDAIHAANLLCRLRRPKAFLEGLSALLKPSGRLVLTTPCTWLEEYTPQEHWLPTEELSTLEAIKQILNRSFQLEQVGECPMLIRETSRKYQWTVSQTSSWKRT